MRRVLLFGFLLCTTALQAKDNDWIPLLDQDDFSAFRGKPQGWILAADAKVNPKNKRRLVSAKAGKGVFINGETGRLRNLVTKQSFQDVEIHVEFLLGERSNAGVKMNGMYEIQIYDSAKVPQEKLTGSHCGGIYPRAANKPRYHTIDKGVPPRVNAALPPGKWQTLDIIFQSPRFDKDGKKTKNGKFVRVVLNGKVIHENVEVKYATGAVWNRKKEVPRGPILLQADHGPIAFRNVKARIYKP